MASDLTWAPMSTFPATERHDAPTKPRSASPLLLVRPDASIRLQPIGTEMDLTPATTDHICPECSCRPTHSQHACRLHKG